MRPYLLLLSGNYSSFLNLSLYHICYTPLMSTYRVVYSLLSFDVAELFAWLTCMSPWQLFWPLFVFTCLYLQYYMDQWFTLRMSAWMVMVWIEMLGMIADKSWMICVLYAFFLMFFNWSTDHIFVLLSNKCISLDVLDNFNRLLWLKDNEIERGKKDWLLLILE